MAGMVRSDAYQRFIRELVTQREAQAISQAKLAEKIGKPASFVGKYELGERRLDVIETLVILRALEIEPVGFFKVLSEFAQERL